MNPDRLIAAIALGVGIISIAAAVWYGRHALRSKRLDWVTHVDFSLGDVAAVDSRLQVRFGSELVANLGVLVVQLYNTGDLPISPEDFDQPLEIVLSDHVTILTVEAQGVPEDLFEPEIELGESRVLIPPLLLNPGDSVRVRIVLDGETEEIRVLGRIAGVREFRRTLEWATSDVRRAAASFRAGVRLYAFLTVTFAASLIASYLVSEPNIGVDMAVWLGLALILSVVVVLVSAYNLLLHWSRRPKGRDDGVSGPKPGP